MIQKFKIFNYFVSDLVLNLVWIEKGTAKPFVSHAMQTEISSIFKSVPPAKGWVGF